MVRDTYSRQNHSVDDGNGVPQLAAGAAIVWKNCIVVLGVAVIGFS